MGTRKKEFNLISFKLPFEDRQAFIGHSNLTVIQTLP